MNSKSIFYLLLLLLFVQFTNAQQSQDIIGSWSGWYEEGQKNYDVRLEVERFNGIVYEGTITLVYDDKEAQFSIEGDLENNIFLINERDMISQYAPEYIVNPQWCKADYEFTFSNLGDRFQLKGIAKVPEVNIAYIRGIKTYNSPNCIYFEKGEIKLQRKNLSYEGDVYLEKQKEKVVYVRKKGANPIDIITGELIGQPKEYEKVVIGGTNPTTRYNKEGKRLATPNSKPRVVYQKKEKTVEVDSTQLVEIKKDAKKRWLTRFKEKVFRKKGESITDENKVVATNTPKKAEVKSANEKPKKRWLTNIFKGKEEDSVVVVKKDSLIEDKKVPVVDTVKKIDLTENQGREVIEAKMIESDEGIAQIQVWDNRSVDGDIISIYHNGKLVEENISLLKEKKELSITLDKGKNVIVMHAVNLGEIPPNSAAMNISTGEKKYSMVLTSDTKKSESIVIYYYP
ncbi:hypothetical protein UJ101_02120 [Flavobacteriaceae bacterium UJ101]|nr:hypothetical protein UJ101_02120 [Flavobacteriaceae bacterium UJ101]